MSEACLHIFDVDGTLLDSMSLWDNLAHRYLAEKGLTAPADLKKTIEAMTLAESTAWFHEALGIPEPPAEIERELLALIERQYREEVRLFPGAAAFLHALRREGGRMVIFTTSDLACITPALRREGVLALFDEIYTAATLGHGKSGPEGFLAICRLQGVSPAETLVYEDADYAIAAARAAGCRVRVCPNWP